MPILFDIDDTLLDDRGAQDVYLGALYSAHRARLPGDETAFRAAWRRAIAEHFPRYLEGEISLREQQRARVRDVFAESTLSSSHADAIVDEFLHEYERAWRVFPDTLATLDALRDSALAVVGNGSTEQQLRKLRRVGIFDRFRVIAISESSVTRNRRQRSFVACARPSSVSPRNASISAMTGRKTSKARWRQGSQRSGSIGKASRLRARAAVCER